MRPRQTPPVTRAEVAARLASAGAPRAEDIAARARPCAVLARGDAGSGRIGGRGRAAKGARWPTVSGTALTPVLEVDLEAIASVFPGGTPLPRAGLLGVWFDVAGGHPSRFALTYVGPGDVAIDLEPPSGTLVLPEVAVTARAAWSLPSHGSSVFFEDLELAASEVDALSDVLSLWDHEHVPDGARLLGYAPDGDAYVDAALVTDEDLRARWFARPVKERVRPDAELAAAARAFCAFASFAEDAVPDLGGDGAWATVLVRESCIASGKLGQEPPSRDASAFFART